MLAWIPFKHMYIPRPLLVQGLSPALKSYYNFIQDEVFHVNAFGGEHTYEYIL